MNKYTTLTEALNNAPTNNIFNVSNMKKMFTNIQVKHPIMTYFNNVIADYVAHKKVTANSLPDIKNALSLLYHFCKDGYDMEVDSIGLNPTQAKYFEDCSKRCTKWEAENIKNLYNIDSEFSEYENKLESLIRRCIDENIHGFDKVFVDSWSLWQKNRPNKLKDWSIRLVTPNEYVTDEIARVCKDILRYDYDITDKTHINIQLF